MLHMDITITNVWKDKNSAYIREYCCCGSNWTFRKHHWDKFCIKTLVWRHTNFNWFRNWSQLTIQCVFVSLSGPAIDLQKMLILAKIINSNEVHFDLGGYVNKQNCRITLKSRRTQTSHCLVRILVQRHNWHIFLRKWARKGRKSMAKVKGHVEQCLITKIEEELRFDTVGQSFVECRQR